MSYLKAEYQKVFKFAVSVAKQKQKASGGRLTWPKALQRAWKDPRVLAKKEAYHKKKKAYEARKKARPRPKPKPKAKSRSKKKR